MNNSTLLSVSLLVSLVCAAGCGDAPTGPELPAPCTTPDCEHEPEPPTAKTPPTEPQPKPQDPANKPSDPAPSQCKDIAGKWVGTIKGKANTILPNLDITGDVTMVIVAGQAAAFTMTKLDIIARSTLLPALAVPVEIGGTHPIQCNDLKIDAPVTVQGVKGSGTIRGSCNDTQCVGKFDGGTADGQMNAKGDFVLTRK